MRNKAIVACDLCGCDLPEHERIRIQVSREKAGKRSLWNSVRSWYYCEPCARKIRDKIQETNEGGEL